MKTSYNFELIKDYIDGLLDSKTANEIKHTLATDETARTIAKGILIMNERFKDDHEAEQYLDHLHEKNQNLIQEKIKDARSTKSSWIKVAAAVVILASTSIVYFSLSDRSSLDGLLLSELESPYRISTTLRNASTEKANQGYAAYNIGDYENALVMLKDVKSAQAIYVKGLSHLYRAEYPLAIEEFLDEGLVKSRFEEQSRWYLAVAYLKIRDMEKSREVLQFIVAKANHYKKREAEKLLDFLNKD